jgi:hypothetical protein
MSETDIEKERPAFEAWCRAEGFETELWIHGYPESGYDDPRVCDYWTGWKARAASDAALRASHAALAKALEDVLRLLDNGIENASIVGFLTRVESARAAIAEAQKVQQ